ncbi:tetratricopeptide repeat protein, partial [Microcystis sp.]|uniref:tetratricopeptide repeat protein n=1 Tax=Microcystis sp. TaxID=1127 RepID=UPI00391BB394
MKIKKKLTIIMAIATFLLTISPLSAQTTPNPVKAVEFYNRGVDRLTAGDYSGAIADFTQALQLEPKDADAYYNRGYAELVLGQYERAIADYTQALTINPNYVNALGNRCYVHYLTKKYEAAVEDCTKAIALNGNFADFFIYRGNAKDDLGRHAEAIEDYTKALSLQGTRGQDRILYNRALAYNRAGQQEMALRDYDESLKINANFAEAYHNRGLTHYKLGNREKAIA